MRGTQQALQYLTCCKGYVPTLCGEKVCVCLVERRKGQCCDLSTLNK